MKERSGYLSRQKNFILNLIMFTLGAHLALGQTGPVPVGAEAWGVGAATVAASDSYAVFNNIAGVAGNKGMQLLSSYDSHYGFEGLNTLAFAVLTPLSQDLSSGISIRRFGDKLYSELALGIGAGHRIGRYTLGVKINYLQNAVTATSVSFSRKALMIELGGIAKVTERFSFGAHIYNLTQSSYSGLYGNKVPTQLRVGFLFLPINAVRFSAEVEKDTDFPVALKTGLAYQILKSVWLRTGLSTRPIKNHFGAGFTGGNFTVDYAVHSSIQLGWSHHFSISYAFLGKKTKSEERE